MSLFQTGKPKSAPKVMIPTSSGLSDEVLKTLSHIAQMVGATLGPGGRQVLIERPEMNMKPIMTKDGVTVIKNLGYTSATKQLILEAARDAATRTASEAGDGTTTATILSSAISDTTAEMVRSNPRISPQRIVRELQDLVKPIVQKIKEYTLPVTPDNMNDVLLKVATLSANGDGDLAQAVLEALDAVGDEGNMTIIESSGNSKYTVDRINGYTVDRGYEEGCRNFANGFLNDKSGTMVVANNPVFLLFDGTVNDTMQVFHAFQAIAAEFSKQQRNDRIIVLVAHGFSDAVLGDLYFNWNAEKSQAKVVPLLTERTAVHNSSTNFLYDLQAYTGVPIFNPVDRPIADINAETLIANCRATYCEIGRFRSSIYATEDMEAIQIRVDELKEALKKPESEYEEKDINVRIGKLTSGIARLNIYAPSAGETREKRDRAEDAWMAIKGAIKHGALPGGGFILVKLSADLLTASEKLPPSPKQMAMQILSQALLKPVQVLYHNYGYLQEEIESQITKILQNEDEIFDILEQAWVPKYNLLDSAPAVIEAIRNSISIASLLGTVGGIIAFQRDSVEDAKETKFADQFNAAINSN